MYRLVRAELGSVELCIQTACLDQLLVATSLHYAALIDHQYLVRIPDRREPVGDDERGAPGKHGLERSLQGGFRFRIKVGGSFVQNDDVGCLEQQSSDGDALPLPAGQSVAAISHDRVQAVRQGLDEGQDLGGGQRSPQLLLGPAGLGVQEVRTDAGAPWSETHLAPHTGFSYRSTSSSVALESTSGGKAPS
jgi:hypothetical protein